MRKVWEMSRLIAGLITNVLVLDMDPQHLRYREVFATALGILSGSNHGLSGQF